MPCDHPIYRILTPSHLQYKMLFRHAESCNIAAVKAFCCMVTYLVCTGDHNGLGHRLKRLLSPKEYKECKELLKVLTSQKELSQVRFHAADVLDLIKSKDAPPSKSRSRDRGKSRGDRRGGRGSRSSTGKSSDRRGGARDVTSRQKIPSSSKNSRYTEPEAASAPAPAPAPAPTSTMSAYEKIVHAYLEDGMIDFIEGDLKAAHAKDDDAGSQLLVAVFDAAVRTSDTRARGVLADLLVKCAAHTPCFLSRAAALDGFKRYLKTSATGKTDNFVGGVAAIVGRVGVGRIQRSRKSPYENVPSLVFADAVNAMNGFAETLPVLEIEKQAVAVMVDEVKYRRGGNPDDVAEALAGVLDASGKPLVASG